MTQYRIHIQISDVGLDAIYTANQEVALVQGLQGQPVVWSAFRPLLQNTVTWNDDYLVYGSAGGPFVPGTEVIEQANIVATLGATYTISQGMFTSAATGSPGLYTVVNQQDPGYGFGLAQDVVVNGKLMEGGPVSVTPIFLNAPTMFLPATAVFLFLTPVIKSGTVLAGLPPNTLDITLDPNQPVADVTFNNDAMAFTRGTSR